LIEGILIEGLIYGIVVLGVFITFRVLNFCDMTVDGSFPLGACVLAACLLKGISPALAIAISFFAGALAGLVTTMIYTKLRIPDLLAGILTMTMLYSVNLHIMSNRANVSFIKIPTFFSMIKDFMKLHFPAINSDLGIFIVLLLIVIIVKALIDLFFHTDLGLSMGALGDNEQMIISQGVNPKTLRVIGICVGNAMASVAGAFSAMYSGFADVGSGTGIIVSALASLMIGEFVLRSNKIGIQTLRVIIGSIIYRAFMYLGRRYGIKIGLTSNDLKLITGILIIICLAVSQMQGKFNLAEHLKTKRSKR
jgi:putative ABC transport system permease protein